MIFVTVGTDHHKFDRLINALDKVVYKELGQKMHMQIGPSSKVPINTTYDRMLSPAKMDYYYKNSNIIICQGGPGTIFNCLLNGKKPFVLPRNPKYNEVIDNHQIVFCEHLARKNLINLFYEPDDIIETLLNNDVKVTSTIGKISFNTNDFITELEKIIQSI